jgi:hypothetical protein
MKEHSNHLDLDQSNNPKALAVNVPLGLQEDCLHL